MVLIIFKILFFGGFFLFIETIQLYLIPVHPVAFSINDYGLSIGSLCFNGHTILVAHFLN